MNTPSSLRMLPKILRLVPLLLLGNLAHATNYHFETFLSGPNEGNSSPGVGFGEVYYDDSAQTMRVVVSFSGLTSGVTASHIHAATALPNTGTAGVATQTPTFTGFPLGVTAGSYDHTFDMTLASSFRAGYISLNGGTAASASAALLGAMLLEETYLNIHTTNFAGGEIRGFLHNVPEAGSTLGLMALGLGAAGIARRRKLQA